MENGLRFLGKWGKELNIILTWDSPEFTKPGRMCHKIFDYLEHAGQPKPNGKAEIYAAVLNGSP